MPMRRTLASILALAAIGVVASWGLSFIYPHALPMPRGFCFRCERGTLQLRHQRQTELKFDADGNAKVVAVSGAGGRDPNSVHLQLSSWRPYSVAHYFSGGTITTRDGTHAEFGYRVDVWGVTHWSIAAALLLAWCLVMRRALRVADIGSCPSCGYDLRASPDRCPECGALPQRNPQATA